MKTVVDNLDTDAGWVGSGSVDVHNLNTIHEFIAGERSASLVVEFPEGSLGDGLSKTYALDVAAYDQLVISFWSRNKASGIYRVFSHCPYILVINGTVEYGVRVWPGFVDSTFDISTIDEITSIEIRANHNDEDYLVMSYAVASYDELPYDLYQGLKERIEQYRDSFDPGGLPVGTLTGAAGDSVIDIVGTISHLWRYTVITISGGGNSETHQLGSEVTGGFEMTSLFDGETLVNDYTAAEVSIQFPVVTYSQEKEVMFPSMVLHGMEVERVERSTDIEQIPVEFRDGDFLIEHEHSYNWPITVEIVSRSLELNSLMATWVRTALASHRMWVNGRKIDIDFTDTAIESEPVDSFDVIPRLAYTVNVEIKERVWTRRDSKSGQATIAILPMT